MTSPQDREGVPAQWAAYDLGWDSAPTPAAVNPYELGTDLYEEWDIGRADAMVAAATVDVNTDTKS